MTFACSVAVPAIYFVIHPRPRDPWCSGAESEWVAVEGRGTVHSYTEVHHAIQPAFKQHLPYLVLVVELDTQESRPPTKRFVWWAI